LKQLNNSATKTLQEINKKFQKFLTMRVAKSI
jgi:hypothetical protein